jgi:hypothetical protein
MNHSLNTNSGKKTFGTFKESLNAGDYIYNKKAKTTFCSGNVCIPSRTVNTQNNYLLLKRSNYLNYYACLNDFNTANLNVNLLTSLNLTNVPIIQNNNAPYISPTPILTSATPYLDYIIDPSGNLFGNTSCGLLNYEQYLVPNTQ